MFGRYRCGHEASGARRYNRAICVPILDHTELCPPQMAKPKPWQYIPGHHIIRVVVHTFSEREDETDQRIILRPLVGFQRYGAGRDRVRPRSYASPTLALTQYGQADSPLHGQQGTTFASYNIEASFACSLVC